MRRHAIFTILLLGFIAVVTAVAQTSSAAPSKPLTRALREFRRATDLTPQNRQFRAAFERAQRNE